MEKLSDEFFLSIKGNTDSECLFFLIMEYVHSGNGMSLIEAIKKAFECIVNAQSSQKDPSLSRLNIVITDGSEMIATRFSSKGSNTLSLSYARSDDNSVIVASEPLDNHLNEWDEVPVNHYLLIKNNGKTLNIMSFD